MIVTSKSTVFDKIRWVWNKYSYKGKIKKGSDPVHTDAFAKSTLGSFSPLWWRIFNLLWALIVTTWSLATFWGPLNLWLIYMTHWGLLLILAESGFGVAVAVAGRCGLLGDDTCNLPWYVKTYWVLYNTSIAVAFLISVFYWCLLHAKTRMINFALDVNMHAMNSIVMALELAGSSHPSRLAHCYQPMILGLLYLLFGVVYYFAGGVDPWGHKWVYPVVDWSTPAPTSVVVTLTALSLVLVHIVVVALAAARDATTARCRPDKDICLEENYNDAGV